MILESIIIFSFGACCMFGVICFFEELRKMRNNGN